MALTLKTRNQDSSCNVSIWILLLSNFLVYQLSSLSNESTDAFRTTDTLPSETSLENVLSPPKGKAVALPSVRIATDSLQSEQQYGGKGDKAHLGGFTDMDHHGISPAVWKWMVSYIGVHSVLDVGCGRGFSTSWFHFHGIDVLCVEGSHDAFENTVIPDTTRIVEHDFSRGPWWPEKTYDAVWCVEFLEHVCFQFQ
jgi:Methyltransferase domain